jgi:hypothetical protein
VAQTHPCPLKILLIRLLKKSTVKVGYYYSIALVNLATVYTWSVPAGTVIIAGQGTTEILVEFASGFASGNISVSVSNCFGNNTHPRSLTVTKATVGCPGLKMMEDIPPDNSEKDIILKVYPNPFSSKATLMFEIPQNNHVNIEVYDLNGKLIQVLFNGDVAEKQEYNLEFDGSILSTGIYIYKMTTNEEVITGKMVLSKD